MVQIGIEIKIKIIIIIEVRGGQSFNSDQHTTVGRRLADGGVLTSSGEISGTDREDSPLQSKRSSMFEIIIRYLYLFNFYHVNTTKM